MTESAVTLITRPLSMAVLNRDLQGLSSSIPIMQPIPRIFLTCDTEDNSFSRPAIILFPRTSARLSNPSLSIVLIVASAAAQDSGLPPKVDP